MTYYFPLGRPATIPTNIAYSNQATTASSAVNASISALTASYAASVQNTPPSGPAGQNQDIVACGVGPAGPVGPTGPEGPQGTSIFTCPPGTKDCSSSIPDKLPGFPIVCLEIPDGCTSAGTPCPTSLDGFATTSTTTLDPSTTSTTTSTSTSTSSTTTLPVCGADDGNGGTLSGTCPPGENCCLTNGDYGCIVGECAEN